MYTRVWELEAASSIAQTTAKIPESTKEGKIIKKIEDFWLAISSLEELKISSDKSIFYVLMRRSDWTDKPYIVPYQNLWIDSDNEINKVIENKIIYKWNNSQIDVLSKELLDALSWFPRYTLLPKK